ncbi:unnamed protein product [Heligmosomoides polygyrus]|uniref:Uncharacterized protein n=1 Tax=Heligmosomoides polygyrus TaxID=6339 RepID=A0A3P8E240_HELPZ|nr:unnamed protein product [Heligmosomoides polygyrus]
MPIVGLRNDLNGSALQYIRLTSMFDAFSPYIYKNKVGVIEISRAMKLHKEDNSLNPDQIDLVVRFKVELEVHLSNYFGTRVMLAIYGSTLNGFGTRSCDVDMSLSFPAGPPRGVEVGGMVCPDLVMRAVAKALVDYPNARDEQYICAKVPIVRFRGKDMDIEADISYRNDLALHNTELLNQYCKWDEDRLPTLGIWVKTGMHIPNESQYVNGWNVDFCKFVDVGQCQRVGISTYELFVGFLDYFSTHFQYDAHIIQINVPGTVSKVGRWYRCPMVIRDPFELDHNLAQGVDEDSAKYPVAVLISYKMAPSHPLRVLIVTMHINGASMSNISKTLSVSRKTVSNTIKRYEELVFRYIRSCMRHSRTVFMDQNLRTEFLASKGFRRGAFEKMRMSDDLLREYGVYLLHACVPVQQPPVRKFHGRDRTMSCSTNTSAS